MSITKEDIKKLAALSRIDVSEEETASLQKRLESVLAYASGLKDIAEKYGPAQMPKQHNVVRNDMIIPTDSEPILAQAPEVQDHSYVVPKIVKSNK